MEYFTVTFHSVAWTYTPKFIKKILSVYSQIIHDLQALRRQVRKWQQKSHPDDKTRLNHIARRIKITLLTLLEWRNKPC